jgi:DNA-binding CsgD family transcriptional regulator
MKGTRMTSPAGAVLDSPLPSAELRTKTDRHRRPLADGEESFVRAARPVLDQLALDLDGTSVGVVLTNTTGHVMDVRAAKCGDVLTAATRAEAPIFHPGSGRMIGAIALASLAREGTALMLPLATHAAREIESRLFDDSGLPEKLMLQRFLQERRRAKEPIVFINRSHGWESLTGSEEAVVGLVALGLTNREVGAHLFISRHTVDFHLRSIFRKLDVRSRVDLTRVAVQRSASAT